MRPYHWFTESVLCSITVFSVGSAFYFKVTGGDVPPELSSWISVLLGHYLTRAADRLRKPNEKSPRQ